MPGAFIAAEDSVELAKAYLSGLDPSAADRLYYRHRDATLHLAETGLSDRLRVRIDPEDVYQSVSLILFRGLSQGRFHLTRAGDLRALLAQLTRRRIQKKAEQNLSAKRSLNSEVRMNECCSIPSIDDYELNEVEKQDEIDVLLSQIGNARHRRVIQMALDGEQVGEIAIHTAYSTARVRQILRTLAQKMFAAKS